jgi:hypothetical protein
MNDLPHKIGEEGNTASNQELENVEAQVVASEVTHAASNTVVTINATLSSDNSSITVSWYPHVSYSALVRVDQTTGDRETLLGRYDLGSPPYYDNWNIVRGNSYVYELFVPGNSHSPFRSAPATPRVIWKPVNPRPQPIDEVISDEAKTLDQLASEETDNTDAGQAEK